MARKTRVKIFAQNNSEFLKNSLSLLGENFDFSCCKFDSVLQESFDEQDFDIAVLIPDFEKVKKHDDWIISELSFWQTVWKNLDGKKIVQIGYDYDEYGTDGFYLSTLSGQIKQIRTINQTLAEELPKGSYFIDLDAISGFFGKDNCYEKTVAGFDCYINETNDYLKSYYTILVFETLDGEIETQWTSHNT